VLVEHRAVVREEVEQVRHLLEVGLHARDVTPQVHVVELEIDDVLYRAAGRTEMARIVGGACRRTPDHRRSQRYYSRQTAQEE
jgi:hypothetical protein